MPTGTNTYLVGISNPYTLIDTGEGKPEYITVLEQALRETAAPTNPTRVDISDIVISHWHQDHVGGLPFVLALLRRLWDERNPGGSTDFEPPRLHKFPLVPESPSVITTMSSVPPDSYTRSPSGGHFHDLHDSQILSSLEVIHAPGHTADSISLFIPTNHALYTADSVLGQGTAVFEDLGAYISTLRKLLAFRSSTGEDYTEVYPGHGPVVTDPHTLIESYIAHRLQREAEIVQVLKDRGRATIWSIVGVIYAGYPESVWVAAAHGVELHLKKLESEGRVEKLGGEGKDSEWRLV
jgi:endoribonuclease LACTB2